MKLHKILSTALLATFMSLSFNAFSAETPIADSVITSKIESKIAMDQSLSVFKVGVSTTNGIVTLAGSVNSDSDASAAIEIAQSTDGVTDVNASKLVIKDSQQPLGDTVITAKVKGLLIKEKLLGNKDTAPLAISVETNNGVVSLNGTVTNQTQADNAIKIAKSVTGVKSVESRIVVR